MATHHRSPTKSAPAPDSTAPSAQQRKTKAAVGKVVVNLARLTDPEREKAALQMVKVLELTRPLPSSPAGGTDDVPDDPDAESPEITEEGDLAWSAN